MDTCESIKPVYWVGWVFFCIISTLCWIFGSHRGSPVRKINFHTVTLTLWFVTTWYGAGSVGALCGMDSAANPGIMDFSPVRLLSFVFLLSSCSVLITFKLNESTIDVIIHLIVSIATQIFFWIAITIDQNRIYWATTSLWFAFLLIWHIYSESKAEHCDNPRFALAFLWSLIIYILCYYVAIFCGPWFADIISLLAQEIILLFIDIVFGARMLYTMEHYGWSEKLSSTKLVSPGDLSSMQEKDKILIIEEAHTNSDL